MPLNEGELSDFVSRAIPDDLPEDPHVSYRPPGWALVPEEPYDPSASAIRLAKWAVQKDVPAQGDMRGSAYALRSKLGRGGFGEVWEAVQLSLGRLVAVKRLREDHLEQAQQIPHEGTRMEGDFRREALTTALLEHPNIMPVHDLGLDEDGSPLLAMKLVNGERWDRMLKADFDQLGVTEYLVKHLPIFIDMCQAVAFAHSRGIVHRDLKPSQVMVGEFGEVLLMDWGLAVLYDPTLVENRFQDSAKLLVPTPREAFNPTGTAAFMAVEQTAETAEDIGPWTDAYLLGGTLYYILTRRAPHGAGTAMESYVQASAGVVEPPERRTPERYVPPELSAICMKALSVGKGDRYGSAPGLIAAVEEYLTGASERRESVALLDEAEATIARGLRSYSDYTECNNLLTRALNLWPRNVQARLIQQRILSGFCHLAVENNDLVLAKLMAESVEAGEERQRIEDRMNIKRRLGNAHVRQKKILAFATAILLVLIMLDAVMLYRFNRRPDPTDAQMKILREREKNALERVAELEAKLGSPGGSSSLPGRDGEASGSKARPE